MATDEYKVQLEVFEGPLDLLLYLIRRDEVDIYNIPIETITSQYMKYLQAMRILDLEVASEFIVMAATLMMIKSRMLLPVEERGELADEDEEQDPRWDLVRQLVEYKKFKDAAGLLHERELLQEDAFPGGGAVVLEAEDAGVALGDVGIFDLITAFNEVLDRLASESIGEIAAERFTVAEKIEVVLRRVAGGAAVRFAELFDRMTSRQEIVCTFLAVLELIRLRQVCAVQQETFGTIEIRGVEDEPESAEQA